MYSYEYLLRVAVYVAPCGLWVAKLRRMKFEMGGRAWRVLRRAVRSRVEDRGLINKITSAIMAAVVVSRGLCAFKSARIFNSSPWSCERAACVLMAEPKAKVPRRCGHQAERLYSRIPPSVAPESTPAYCTHQSLLQQ